MYCRKGLSLLIALAAYCHAQSGPTMTWSKSCTSCFTSEIPNTDLNSDGSNLTLELLQGQHANADAALAMHKGILVVAIGYYRLSGGSWTGNVQRSVAVTAGNRPVLMLANVPEPILAEQDLMNSRAADKTVTLETGSDTKGFLLFESTDEPVLTVTFTAGDEIFRFPFHQSRDHKFLPVEEAQKDLANENSAKPGIPDGGICSTNISFAALSNGSVVPAVPHFARQWIEKNQKKLANFCFNQEPRVSARNVVFVFSDSQSAYNGLVPSVHTDRTVATSPISGSGTITSSYGNTWNYNYYGTVTSTTTTTTYADVPYMDRTRTLYLNAYSDNGTLLASHWRSVTSRQGGDPYNTLGYNLGSMLGSIHMRERLLRDVIEEFEH